MSLKTDNGEARVVRLCHGQWVVMDEKQYQEWLQAIQQLKMDPDFHDHPGEE